MIAVALAACTAADPQALRIAEAMSHNEVTLRDDEGEPSDWIELENGGGTSVSLEGYGLSDDPTDPFEWTFPFVVLGPGERIVVFASHRDRKAIARPLHTSFKLASRGEALLLTAPGGALVDYVELPALPADVSWGRADDGWAYFHTPTPGDDNDTPPSADPTPPAPAAAIVVSEVSPANRAVAIDEDGDTSDWIELRNTGGAPVDVADWWLSDTADASSRWALPHRVIAPGGVLLVWASGKDRRGDALHADFRLAAGEEPVVLGAPGGAVVETVAIPVLPPDASYGRLDDGWHVLSLPTPGEPNRGGERPDPYPAADGVAVSEVMAHNRTAIVEVDGQACDWIELVNLGADPVDLGGYGLSDDRAAPYAYTFPPRVLGPGERALVFLSDEHSGADHARFALSAGGETVWLVAPSGRVVDRFDTGRLGPDASAGRIDGASARVRFATPTPGAPNGAAIEPVLDAPRFSLPAGTLPGPAALELSTEPGAVVRYTLDGSEPGPESAVAAGPIAIDATTVVRAAVFADGRAPGPVATRTYLVGAEHVVPIVSIAAPRAELFDPVDGPLAHPLVNHEVEGHVEVFEPDGDAIVRMDVGFRLSGNSSRILPQKSYRLVARPRYGRASFDYPFFPHKTAASYTSVVLRASGQDQYESKLRDVLGTQLVRESHVDYQDWRPVVVYLNGRYTGLRELREHVDAATLAAEHGVRAEDVTIVRHGLTDEAGDGTALRQLIAYARTHDLSAQADYDVVAGQIDLDNYIDYQIAEIYLGNVDNGNVRCWRAGDGRWRWILYDLDAGLADAHHDTFAYVMQGDGGGDGALPHLFRALMANAGFKDAFLARFGYHLGHTYAPARVEAMIDLLATEIEPEIPRHVARWGLAEWYWRDRVDALRRYARARPDALRMHLANDLGLSPEDVARHGLAAP